MSQPNDPQYNENDDLDIDFSDLGLEESVEPTFSDSADEFSDFSDFVDQDILIGETPLSDDPGMENLDVESFEDLVVPTVTAPLEPETDKKGKKAKKEKPPKAKKEKPPKAKKEKPPKVKKEKAPKPPRDPNAPGLRLEEMLALGACALLVVIFLVLNVFSLTNMSLMFLILMNIIAVVIIAVPFLLFKFGRESSLFEVSLGLAVIALSIGAILLLSVWKSYDFTIKPNARVNSVTHTAINTHV